MERAPVCLPPQQALLDKQGHAQAVLDILVENAGRVNYGVPFESRKGTLIFFFLVNKLSSWSVHPSVCMSAGILGGVQVDGKEQKHWKIYSFEFKSAYVEK